MLGATVRSSSWSRVSLVPLSLSLLACTETLDQAAAHEHALIDHEYDRKDELVDRGFGHAHELLEHQHEGQLELVDHLFDAQLELFGRVMELEPPPGFGPSTCSFSSSPSGAEVFTRNIFDRWEYLGRTPLVIERPLMHAQPIELRREGYAPAKGYMLSDEVRGPCQEHFELRSVHAI